MTTTVDIARARTALLELHRRLLAAQRIQIERSDGRLSANALLQAAITDTRMRWLTRLTELIAGLDGALAEDDGAALDARLAEARALLTAPDPESEFGRRYLQTLQDHPDVVFAHRDATAALT
jgi:hypothetical protein